MPKPSYSSILKNGECLFKKIKSKVIRVCKAKNEIYKSKPFKDTKPSERLPYILRKSGAKHKINLDGKQSKRKSKSKSSKRSQKKTSTSKRRSNRRTSKHSQKKSPKKSQKSGCVKQDLKKYKTRNSPAYPANKCCGMKKKGNDKTMYVSKKKGRSCRWMKLSKK